MTTKRKTNKSAASKNKNPLPAIIVICLFICLLFAFCNKNKEPVNIGIQTDEIVSASKNGASEDEINSDVYSENEEEIFNTESEQKSEKSDNNPPQKDDTPNPSLLETKKETGIFLGMDDSNFVVLVTMDKDGKPVDSRFLIDRKLDFENSDVEIGDNVSFEYTVDSTDKKTIVKIEKQK